jgi:hypothetical protein
VLPDDTALGELVLVESYEFYDRPLLFSCRNAADQFFLALLIEEEKDHDRWLLVPLSRSRLLDVRVGEDDLYNTFSRPESGHAWVLTDFRGSRTSELRSVRAAEIDEAWLPDKGEALRIREPFPLREVRRPQRRAHVSRKDAIDLRLYFPTMANTGRAPLAGIGRIFTELQLSVDALGAGAANRAVAPGARPKPKRLRVGDTELVVEGTFHSSFGVEIAAASRGGLFGNSVLEESLSQLFTLVDAKADEGRLREVLKFAGAKAAQRYGAFLVTVADRGVSFALEWASAFKEVHRTSGLNAEEARAAAQVIQRSDLQKLEPKVVVGTLEGLNRRTRAFEIWVEPEKRQVIGKVSVLALPAIQGAAIGEQYVATVEESIEGKEFLDEERITYTLLDLRPVRPPDEK